jgi:hypothetical protein
MEISGHDEDNEEEEDAADDGPFHYIGCLLNQGCQRLSTLRFSCFL